MEEVGARLVGRFGPEAEGWLAEVPNLAAGLAARWGFVLGELFESGASSVVLRCQWPDGTPAVLKLSPDRALLTKQVEMLRVFGPSGRVPAVLSADAEAGAMVLEEVLPGTEAEDMPQTSLPHQWGELLAALHAVAPPAHWPLDLRGRCEEAFNALLHGSLRDRLIRVRITLTATALRVEVGDPRGDRLPCPRPADATDQFGRGLLLVADLADQWGVEPRSVGKTVYAEWALALTAVGVNPLVAVKE